MKNIKLFNDFILESNSEDGEIVFFAKTKGDLYSMEVKTNNDVNFTTKEYKRGSVRSIKSSIGISLVKFDTIWSIIDDKVVSNINYKIEFDKLNFNAEYDKIQEIYTTWYSNDFKEWRKNFKDDNNEIYNRIVNESKKKMNEDNVDINRNDYLTQYCYMMEKYILVVLYLNKE